MDKNESPRDYYNLRAEITRHGMTMQSVAHAIGLSRLCFYNRMHGKSKFSFDEAKKLAELLSADIVYLMEYRESSCG